MTTNSPLPPAGWYDDPEHASAVRYWDGTQWTHNIAPTDAAPREKQFVPTWLFAWLLGYLAVDRFYLGKVGTGLLKLFTFGGLGVWWLIDLILVLTGSQRDKLGRPLAGYNQNKNIAWIVTAASILLSLILSIGFSSLNSFGRSPLFPMHRWPSQQISPAPPPSPAPPSRAPRSPGSITPGSNVTFSGDGELSTEKQRLAGSYTIEWTTEGPCYYAAELLGEQDFGAQAFTANNPASGANQVYNLQPGSYYLAVVTGAVPDCPWTATFVPNQ